MLNIAKKKVDSEIFTGSMADVSFLLIIYFMVTSVFSATKGLDFQLPKEDPNTPEIKKEESIDIFVPPGEAPIEVDRKPMQLEQVLPYIAEKLKANPSKPVILRTAPEAPYGKMLEVFDELRQAPDKIGMKIKTISIPTQREIENIWTLMGVE